MATDTEAPGTPGKAYADKDDEHAIEEVHSVVKRLLDEGQIRGGIRENFGVNIRRQCRRRKLYQLVHHDLAIPAHLVERLV